MNQPRLCNGGSRRCLRKLVSCRATALPQLPAQVALDKWIKLSIEHRLSVSELESGPDVLDQRVRLEHVIPNLRPELSRHDLASNLIELRRRLLLLALEQSRLQHFHRHLAVFHLRPLVLASDNDA